MNAKIASVARSVFSAVLLAAVPPLHAQADVPTPPPSEPANPVLAEADVEKAKQPADIAPPVRLEKKLKRGPVHRIHIEERDEQGNVVRQIDRSEPNFEQRIEPEDGAPEGGKRARRFDRNGPMEDHDVILRNYYGSGGIGVVSPRPPADPMPNGERAQHVQEAIHHLHAAGLHDVADRLEARLERLRAEDRPGPQIDGKVREEIEQLKREHQKLQQELRKIQKKLTKGEKNESAEKPEKPAKPAE